MLYSITISLTVLVIINLLLLKFSCNKTPKQKKNSEKPTILTPEVTISQQVEKFALTGS